jgi:putative phosphoribosyl transferase
MWMFKDRVDAGKRLAHTLHSYRAQAPVVLGVPRGGVVVAAVVAKELGAPLDVIVVRKLGVPFQPELGMGAVGEGGVRVINDEVVRMAGVGADQLAAVEERERTEVEARAKRFRGVRPAVPLEDRTVIIVDDGIATGSTVKAACQLARAQGARRVVVAVPVGPSGVESRLGGAADEVVCLEQPSAFYGVGQWYDDFTQTTDAEVGELLTPASGQREGIDEEVRIDAGTVSLGGRLTLPGDARALVVFAHGSGSSRHSPRNQYVAGELNRAGLGSLLFDLLTEDEERDRGNVFDIELLAERLGVATTWVMQNAPGGHRIGYFGASTGAAAALVAAAAPESPVDAVVSRGGRPDLAGSALSRVRAPTLLIVGGHDSAVLALNRDAQAQLTCPNRLAVVPGATHLFEEPGTLQQAAALARDWFLEHVAG